MKKVVFSCVVIGLIGLIIIGVAGIAKQKEQKLQREWDDAVLQGRRAAIIGVSAEANPYTGHHNYCEESQAWLDGYLSEKEESR